MDGFCEGRQMTIETKNKKVSDMTEEELEKKIMHTVSKSLFILADGIAKLKEEVLNLAENK
jgi:hypothetical protein